MSKKCLWVFGNAVQDITIDVDMERLSHDPTNKNGEMMRLSDRGVEINPRLTLIGQIGLQNFAIPMELAEKPEDDLRKNDEAWPILKGGRKYTLKNNIDELKTSLPAEGGHLVLPCESLTWGGGGVNVMTFLRALAPGKDKVPIRYTDVAMSRMLPSLIKDLKAVVSAVGDSADNLYDEKPAEAENYTNDLAEIVADHAPDRSLEVYLASLPVEGMLYRTKEPRFRRNLVFSRVHSAYREVNNKIILRGSSSDLPDHEEQRIASLLNLHNDDVGAILLNSVKDGQMFKAAYCFYKSLHDQGNDVVAILAMTEAMQKFTKWMLEPANCDEKGKLPPFILVFNETEAQNFTNKLGGNFAAFMEEDGLPDIKKFAELAIFLRGKFDPEKVPRIYVTLGPRGSLGIDASGHVIYAWIFSKSGATIYDTNACGDAYCAAIALLEWAKRHGHPNIAKVNFQCDMAPSAHEMEYFMAVATAAAYCKATNRHGRVRSADLKDLLQHHHLASIILPTAEELANITAVTCPECADANFRLREPSQARFHDITDDLIELLA